MTHIETALEAQISNGGGLTEDEVQVFINRSEQLLRRIERGSVRNFQAEVSIKDRETPSQQVTLELWLNDLPKLVAISENEDLPTAFADVSSKVLRQLNRQKDYRVKRRENPFRNGTELPEVDPELI